jgi:hypothetical protein
MLEMIRPMLSLLRIVLLSAAWVAALLQIVTGADYIALVNVGAIAFAGFVVLTLTRLRRDTVLILLLLVVVGWALLDHFPTLDEWAAGGRYVIIFTALLPTMAMVRATASLMPSVHRTQDSLANLPASASAGGFHLAANIFGAVINTGSLAILSAALPKNASDQQRRLAAEAALRGMVTAAAWSPFFIAFAIGQGFVGETYAWIAIAMGSVTAILFALASFWLLDRTFSFGQLRLAIDCLKPVLLRLSIVLGAVLSSAILFDFTALSAVVVVMPLLVLLQFLRYPEQIRPIIADVTDSMKAIADDILIIGTAMLIGYFAMRTGAFTALVSSLYEGVIPGWFALIITPLAMMLLSVIGVHPVISSTALLAVFSGGHADVNPALLMQAHLIGWGAGTMSSIASLSVIMCASLYKLPSRQLALGPNLWAGFGYAGVGGCLLSLINMII